MFCLNYYLDPQEIVIILGDFNAEPHFESIEILRKGLEPDYESTNPENIITTYKLR